MFNTSTMEIFEMITSIIGTITQRFMTCNYQLLAFSGEKYFNLQCYKHDLFKVGMTNCGLKLDFFKFRPSKRYYSINFNNKFVIELKVKKIFKLKMIIEYIMD